MKKKRQKIMKVLIVDDSAILRYRLKDILSAIQEIEIVGEAQDVKEAIEFTKKLKPDVVILDIRMPKGTGFNVLKYIKKEHPDTIVIMLTNYPYPQYSKKCMDLGADFFFDKFNEFDRLIDVLEKIITNSPA
jgi:DNA-binding NarL/FixJ family response regulator